MIGRILANYRVVAELGAGGMGVVYKAVDLRLDRPVALKMLPPGMNGDAERRARFLQEARAASALNDPHIITIYDIFTEGGTDFIVMEYVEGRTLREVIAAGLVPIADALDLVLQIAEGVTSAHAAGIVHRDLKPGNVMVTERGRVKVLDFGLAKLTRINDDDHTTAGPAHTITGALMGTVEYMSPEQASGEAVDQRSDIFSLGAILYELLAGTRPFKASHPAGVLHEILYGTLVPPSERRAGVGPALDAVVARALERELTKRYQSMDALVSDLREAGDRIRSHVPARPSAITWTDLAPVVVRERRSLPRWGVAVVAAVIAVIAATAIPTSRNWIRARLPVSRPAAAPAAAATALPSTPYELTQQGFALLRRFDRPGNIDAAIQAFERAINLDPKYTPAHAGVARGYARQADSTREGAWATRAVDAARHAIELDPYLADAHVSLGFALTAAGDYPHADEALRKALLLDPNNGGAWLALGQIAYLQDRRPDAEEAFQKALDFTPDDWQPARALGNLSFRAGDYDQAIRWYTRAVAIAPDNAITYGVLGATYHMKGDYASAATALQKSISIRPTYSAYTNLGTALFYGGRFRESVAAFEKGVELNPNTPMMWGNLGDAYRWTPGGRERAGDAYLRAIQLLEPQVAKEPQNVQAHSLLALYLAKRGDTRRSAQELSAIPELPTRDLNTLYHAALTSEINADRDGALRWLELALGRGYSMREVAADPELTRLREDVRYHRLATRFEKGAAR